MSIPGPVVVTGGGGFVGSHLVGRLVEEGHEVTALDIAFPHAAEAWWPKEAQRRHVSVLNAAAVELAVDGAGTVFHLAADMGGVAYFHSPADLAASMRNGQMTLNVLRACLARGVERVVFAASACTYPVESVGAVPLGEEAIGRGTPDQLYGAEKLHGLRLVDSLPGGRVAVLDTVYGPGSEREGPRAKMPASLAWKALLAAETGRLEIWGDGSQLRCQLHVDDAVSRILAIAGDDEHRGPVNVTGSHPLTCTEVAELCLDLAGVEAELVFDQAAPAGVAARTISGAKYAALYGEPRELNPRAGFGLLMDWLRG